MTDKKKRVGGKPISSGKKKISFAMSSNNGNADSDPMSLSNMVDTVQRSIAERLEKSVKPANTQHYKGKYQKSKVVFTSNQHRPNFDGVEIKPWKRLRDEEQKEIAQIDPYISAIISTRCSQGAACGQPSDSKFDKGCRIQELKPLKQDDFESEDHYKQACQRRDAEMAAIMEWVQTCGTSNRHILDYAFSEADWTFKYCTLKQYIEAQIRNVLTFGRYATQVLRNNDGIPVLFRPVAVETIMPVRKGERVHLSGNDQDTAGDSLEDAAQYNALPDGNRPVAYVQRINGADINFYTEDDMKIGFWQKQALFDLNEYPLSPIELAIYFVYVHNQTLNYLRNQFVKGMLNKCIISVESTDPNVSIDQPDLDEFKAQIQNYMTRTENSSVVPFIGGPIRLNRVDLDRTPKDLEFLQVEEHIVRALCSSFQISPQEMGYGHLSLPQGGLTQANKAEEMVKGEERGLRNLLDLIFEGLNEIVFENFPEAKKKYRLTFVGVGSDTRDDVINRNQAELQTTATMNSLWSDSEKTGTVPYGGNVPLAPLFHTNVAGYMSYGKFMAKYFGDKDAEKNPYFDFLINPNLNQAYQQNKMVAMQAQMQQQQAQQQAQQQQMAGAGQQGQPSAQQPPEQEQKSVDLVPARKYKTLLEKYEELKKSNTVSSYFSEWSKIH